MTPAEHSRLTKLQNKWRFLYHRQFVSPYLMEKYLKAKKGLENAKEVIRTKYRGKQSEMWT